MPATFLVSDTHFGHAGVCRFTHPDDATVKLRPWDDPAEMDEEMIRRWNDRVRPSDKVYHLGDLARLNGDKALIRGNHDIFRDDEYREYFRELRAYHVMNGMILSHIPVHEASLGRFGTNIHGHLHASRVRKARGVDARTGEVLYGTEIDPRYHCVCVEQTDFAPILLDDVYKRIEAEGGKIGFAQGNGSAM